MIIARIRIAVGASAWLYFTSALTFGSLTESTYQGPRDRCDETEQHRHGQRERECDQDVEEECSWLTPQIRQEIQGEVEGNGVGDLVRHIREHRCDGFGGGMVESISAVLLDDSCAVLAGDGEGEGPCTYGRWA